MINSKEFEVIIPYDAFDNVSVLSINNLLSCFNVQFILTGYDCDSFEFLVVCPSLSVAKSVLSLLTSLKKVILASVCSPSDKLLCANWKFGEIR